MLKSNIQQEGESYPQQVGLTFKEETSKVIHLEHTFYGAETLTFWKVDEK